MLSIIMQCHVLSVLKQNAIMLSLVKPSVLMQNAITVAMWTARMPNIINCLLIWP
jgi:hypothetical protein